MNIQSTQEKLEGIQSDLDCINHTAGYAREYRKEAVARIDARLDDIEEELERYRVRLLRLSYPGGDEDFGREI